MKRILAATLVTASLFAAPIAHAETEPVAAYSQVSIPLPAEFTQYANVRVSRLPDGMAYDSATNSLVGAPTLEGAYQIQVWANDETNAYTTMIPLTVHGIVAGPIAPEAPVTVNAFSPANIPLVADFTGFTGVQVSGLPTGLTYDAAVNALVGTPTLAGTYTAQVWANNATSLAVSMPIVVKDGGYMNEPPLPPQDQPTTSVAPAPETTPAPAPVGDSKAGMGSSFGTLWDALLSIFRILFSR
ncbi:Serine-rich adhesin for platelets precursor [Corynebacterium kalinowskii]|uniref:Serine-rich adhesin for platelets n=1 Tax=Corynebacterium kalinowskii TaxID=2675216 RepID=A0A6B8VBF5_9CORY|nr:putative Ig domain-containing protein [Corynebacterium kalinowskii]QGU02482.1 Serine-rich adhesin for platelets precursor [Corynebacterium kalinowskii]